MTDQTPDTIRALADRLERRADIEDVGEAYEDVPEVTWEEMREIVGLLREAASTLRALADQVQRAAENSGRLLAYVQHKPDCDEARALSAPPGSSERRRQQCSAAREHEGWTEYCQRRAGHSGPHSGAKGEWTTPSRCSCGLEDILAAAPAPTGTPPDGRAKAIEEAS